MLQEAKAADEKSKHPEKRGKQAEAANPANSTVPNAAVANAAIARNPNAAAPVPASVRSVGNVPPNAATGAQRARQANSPDESFAAAADTAAKEAKAQADLAAAKAKAAIDSLFKRPSK